jgi:hypothetical protein
MAKRIKNPLGYVPPGWPVGKPPPRKSAKRQDIEAAFIRESRKTANPF